MRREEVDERESPKKDRHHRTLWAPDRSTVVYVGNVPIGLTIFEMTESIEMVYVGSNKYVPVRDLTVEQLRRYKEPRHWRTTKEFASGRLAVQAYSTAWRVKWCERWQEAKAGQFASLTSKVVKVLELAAPELARKYEEAERQAEEERRKWEESRQRAEEEAERARREKARQESRRDLLAAIASWEQARSIDAYFQAVERETEQLPDADREHLRGRLAEARSLVGQLDALGPLRAWKTPLER